MQNKRRRGFQKRKPREVEPVEWIPKTELGKQVQREEIDSLEAIWARGKVIKEPEIVDFFLGDLEERILRIGRGKRPFRWVQRMTDSGRRNRYYVMVAVGNKNGYIGLSTGRAKEYGSAIAQALRSAKLKMIKVDRGCGSWDCGCGETHSIPAEATGKTGSVQITLTPAPKGSGLSVNNISKDILELVGIQDVWSTTKGHTKTRSNLALATFDALKQIGKTKR
jgi:small subunit ribosomal protein S5